MHKLTVWLLLIGVGWAVGWYSHEHWRVEPQLAESNVEQVPSQAPAEPGVAEMGSILASPLDELSRLLETDAFQSAIERYESLPDEGDETVVQRARQNILSTASTLVAQGHHRRAEKLLQLYLVAEFRDVEARMLLAEIHQQQKDFRAAIHQLFEAIGYAYRPEMLDRLTWQLRAVIAVQVDAFMQSGDHSGLLELYQYLTQVEPSHAAHFIGLATAQLALNDTESARRSLLLVAQDPDVGPEAQGLLDQLRLSQSEPQPETAVLAAEMIGVPLIRSGNHFLVDVRINDSVAARLLIDTGASMTILTPRTLAHTGIGYAKTGKQYVFNTANGEVTGPVYRLDTLSVADWQVSNLEIGVLELAGSAPIDGLLGMNFLKHFQFFIDQNQALLRLSVDSQ